MRDNNWWKIAVVVIATSSLLAVIAACTGDSPPAEGVESAQTTAGVPDTTAQKPDTTQPKGAMALPPMPVRRYEGKRNPFSPLITLVEEQEMIVAATKPVKREAQTTLEKITLEQLTLTAIFKGAQGYKAIVEEGAGKGHIVEKGTYIGTQGGRIQSISADRIVIVEQTVDPDGKIFTQKKELKLASPSNDPS